MARVGAILGGSALLIYGLKRRSLGGALLSVVGGGLVYRGATGRLPLVAERGIRVARAITVNRPREEVYRFWHDFRNLPRFMRHLVDVTAIDERRSHWVARAPAGRRVEWDAELIEDRAPDRLAWRSLPGSDVDHTGAVTFTDAPAGRGVEVRVVLEVTPPAGTLGHVIARLFGESPLQQVTEDLRHFKQVLEAGEVPTTDGQPAGWSYLRSCA